jgi:apolipoprotein D and lipocalin family protein
LNEGLRSNGEATRITGTAKPVGDGKLEVRFDPFPANLFPGDYWVLWIDESYERAIVGTPGREYLWILSKDPADILSDFTEPLQMIKAQGFEIEKLFENPKRLAPNSRPTLLVEG